MCKLEADKNKKKASSSLWNRGRKKKLLKGEVVKLENVGIKNQQWMWIFCEDVLVSFLSSFKGNANPKRSKEYEYETPLWKKIFKMHGPDHAVFSVIHAPSHWVKQVSQWGTDSCCFSWTVQRMGLTVNCEIGIFSEREVVLDEVNKTWWHLSRQPLALN